jgi:hypothetical protein
MPFVVEATAVASAAIHLDLGVAADPCVTLPAVQPIWRLLWMIRSTSMRGL